MDSVHRVAIFDLRLMNLDRNETNLLVTAKHPYCEIESCCESVTTNGSQAESCYNLVPIDHGLSIPDSLAIYSYEIAWMNFKQIH